LMKVGTSPRSSRVRRGVIARNGDNYLNQCSTLPVHSLEAGVPS